MIALDDTDRQLLRVLVADGTLSAGAAGRAVGLSQPAAWRRIKRLTEAGVLKGRRVEIDLEKAGFGVTVFLGVKLATKGRVSLDDFERAVAAIPEVQTVHHVLGLYDYRLRVVARDIPGFRTHPETPDHDAAGGRQCRGKRASKRREAAPDPIG